MRALLLDAEHKTANVKHVPIPEPGPEELRIRVEAVALNPVDSLYMYNPLGRTGRVIGSDFSGTVDALGNSVPAASGLQIGSRVAGFVQGACSINDRPGAFQEYVVCPWDLVWQVWEERRLEDAAAVSLCGLTAAQALFFRMGLQTPFQWQESAGETTRPGHSKQRQQNAFSVFIYGATTSVGMYAAQLVHRSAEFSGQRVKLYGAASPKHFEMLTSEPYCYDQMMDYHDTDWPTQVLNLTKGKGVDYAYDCISEGSTVADTSKTLASGGKMAIVRSKEGGAWMDQDLPVEPSYGAVWEGLGESVEYQGMSLPASKEARAFAVGFYRWLSEGGKLEPNPVRIMPGSFEAIVEDGMRLLGSGTMGERRNQSDKDWMRPLSAEKMVYRITGR